MSDNAKNLRRLLPRGSLKKIAEDLNMSRQSVYVALNQMKPTNRAVVKALRIIRSEGTADVQRELNELMSLTFQMPTTDAGINKGA
jgi:predicted DNA-binding protein YlxM (UPF0122 family)